MKPLIATSLVFLAMLASVANGYPYFQNQIPNGANIPNPCPQVEDDTWYGVGHRNYQGGGSRNPFGEDFAANDFVWDECFCNHDSDKDGRTNGEELGDPYCVWIPGTTPTETVMDMLSHPGICEPVDSEHCMNQNYWLDCNSMLPFECEAFEDPETRQVEMVIDNVEVPARETSYMCTFMEFPQEIQDGDFHMIGAAPIIDNVEVMHHLIIYACPDDDNVTSRMEEEFSETKECGEMVTEFCNQIIYIWGLGGDLYCFNDEFGIPLGQSGFKNYVMELHWNNPSEIAGTTDASGVRFYYSDVLREYEARTIFIGVNLLEIPPQRERVVQDGMCPSQCTSQMFEETVYIPQIIPHMHLLGKEFMVWHYRDGVLLRTLIKEDDYDYDSPRTHKFNPPIEVLPGDEIRVRCVFDSIGEEDFTNWGDATADEMCIAITMYYPYQASIYDCWSISNDTMGFCGETFWGEENAYACYPLLEEERFWDDFFVPYLGFFESLSQSCDLTGLTCYEGCKEVVETIRTTHPCFVPDFSPWLFEFVLPEIPADALPVPVPDRIAFRNGLASCDHQDGGEIQNGVGDHDHEDDHMGYDPDTCVFASPTPDVSAARHQAVTAWSLVAVSLVFVAVLGF